ncbi:MAG TPA: DNA-directed RNA polymerase subunit beta [Candidatus Limnocylindrales bacterium]|jgi:DNA-directed RNA polymerase subunit beta|nr:DNA-directed RNA polymerase subunit beta [Candidatus Limnocylindrales bacterium]
MLSSAESSTRAVTPSGRISYARIDKKVDGVSYEKFEIPNLIELQLDSFSWFIEKGLRELFDEISPIKDFTGKVMELQFLDYEFGEPKYSEEECRTKDLTFSKPLYVNVELLIKETGEIQRQRVYMGDYPWMTDQGTFVINGAERVVVSQLVRSPGVYYSEAEDLASGRMLFSAKVIPNRGAWLEFETNNKDQLWVKVDRKRKIAATTLLRAVGYEENDAISGLFSSIDIDADHPYIASTLDKDLTHTQAEALIEVYKKLRPGDPPTGENARQLVESLFFNFRRYDLGRVGRYKFDKKLDGVAARMGLELQREQRTITKEDIAAIVGHLIECNRGLHPKDDIDHLGNRRIRANGELIQNAFRIGLLRMERVVRERMTIQEVDKATPNALINIRPVVAAMKEFFGGSQLSQFMDQTNPLAELTSKRRLSALGPGGLSRERAGFDVRDVHHSHYGRICPIETPEGPNIGLIGSLATYGRINSYGFIETPYRKVKRSVGYDDAALTGYQAGQDLVAKSGEVVLKAGETFTTAAAAELKKQKAHAFPIRPVVTDDIEYLPADEEEEHVVAQANAPLDADGHFAADRIPSRYRDTFPEARPSQIEYMDVSPKQVVSVATALIPFLEHDDANRALMGSNMQRQAVPLLEPESPIVGTGMEERAARDSGQVLVARRGGVVTSVTAQRIAVETDAGELDEYRLQKFVRSNQGTCINHRPIVNVGDRVADGQAIADSSSTEMGELALGRNVLVAFMSWEGGNYEDAIVISDRLVRDDLFTSIHIEKHEIESRDTKLGPEEITRDIPNVGEESLKDLDEEGIVYIGAEVRPGDILVGKITPKGETELTAEERLLRAIFGEKAREVKDSSLRLPHGERGKVVEVREFRRELNDDLQPGVNRLVRVSVAQKRKISVGDKMAGRHGNKGVIAKILPAEDMPFLPDGTPVDIILNPLGVPSRMNIGQILETHLGWALHKKGLKAATAVFDGATEGQIQEELRDAGLPETGKIDLRDGRTGELFDRPITVGYIYMLKLHHLVEDKIHARSTGPYSLITQQPLGGKAQFGGQRFGEMEVWALEAYGAANILQELLTVKSDDVLGRVQTYEAIVKGEEIQPPRVPESFKVLIKELRSLGLNAEILDQNEEEIPLAEDDASGYLLPDLGGINLAGFED